MCNKMYIMIHSIMCIPDCYLYAAAKSLSVVSDSVPPQRRQPTRHCGPWDSPGKNTGVGRHFLLQCMKVKSESEVAQSCLTLRDPVDCSPPGSSIHGTLQARVLEWGAIAFSVICICVLYIHICICVCVCIYICICMCVYVCTDQI